MTRSALFANQQPGGVYTIAQLTETPGDVFFVNSTHAAATDAAGAGRGPDTPLATLDYAIGLCTASKGDVIFLMPGHAETDAGIALDVAGVKIVGLGYGRNRPTLTHDDTADDLLEVTAANCQLHNVRLAGAATNATALLQGSTAATDFEAHGIELAAAATPTSLITWSGQRPIIEDLLVTQSADGANYVVEFEAGVDGFIFRRWTVLCPSGLDDGLIYSGGFAHLGYIVEDIVAVGLDTLLVNFISSSAGAPDGLVSNVRGMYSAAVTSVEDGVAAATSKGIAYDNIRLIDATGKRTGYVPLTSAS